MITRKHIVSLLVMFSLVIGMIGVINADPTYAATKKIHVKKKTVTLVVGKNFQQKLIDKKGKVIKATKVKWKSKKKSVAKINKKGKITAVKAGTATMTAKYKGKTYKFTVKVKKKSAPAPTHNSSICFSPLSLTLMEGETKDVTIKTDLGFGVSYRRYTTNISCSWGNWVSSTDCVLHITGNQVGTTTIMVYDTNYNDVYAILTVTVKPNTAKNVLNLCNSLVKYEASLDGRYYIIKSEKNDSYNYYDEVSVTSDISQLSFETSYFSKAPVQGVSTTTTITYDLTKEGVSKINTVQCEISKSPNGIERFPCYIYILEAKFDRTKFKVGNKLNWELVDEYYDLGGYDPPEQPGNVAELASSYADFAFIETLHRMDNFLSEKYKCTMSDFGIE